MRDSEQISEQVMQQASAWFAQADCGDLSAEDDARLARWLVADPIHARAFSRAEAIWDGMGRVGVLACASEQADLNNRPAIHRPAAGTSSARPPVWRQHVATRQSLRIANKTKWRAGVGFAACLALMMLYSDDISVQLEADAMTQTGEQSTVHLPDGSLATLNTDSAIAFDKSGRNIRLLRGEAVFEVQADAGHPFSVVAGNSTITALGTRFIVRRTDEAVRVFVTLHSVELKAGGQSAIVGEGEGASYNVAGAGQLRSIASSGADAWTRGRIRFVNRPLREVIAELARYHRGYIGLVGGGLADRPVSGSFDIDDPVKALDTIEQSLGIGSTRLTEHIILLHS